MISKKKLPNGQRLTLKPFTNQDTVQIICEITNVSKAKADVKVKLLGLGDWFSIADTVILGTAMHAMRTEASQQVEKMKKKA